ncbi:V-type H(+)-translocating pyrophosphatase VP1 [Cardiosporidium cionae]|uniref:H(+)-exporting diphosphatase n=1 Tax=Cardiosporidium cionae TaxID=476202 RepID=A0ABQ7JFI8_9APIC|nr:V-type H(+)-translocating pyrophosphatase VP1 [Cardiosporidium cionae]|eukprot:KAF8822803.1 V-type H(+)-translocating pyrophosphatase VP1 [Cardiosporidium cionae]
MAYALLDVFASLVLIVPPFLGLLWGLLEAVNFTQVEVDGRFIIERKSPRLDYPQAIEEVERQVSQMKIICSHIAKGSDSFLKEEYKFMLVYIVVFSAILFPVVGWETMVSFIVGCLTSIMCGYIGMQVAVRANVRTAHEAWKDLGSGFSIALRAGSVVGFVLVSLGIIFLLLLVLIYRLDFLYGTGLAKQEALFEAIAGYGLGGSSIALFGRVGGGIYTKAADVGADLSGKNEYGMAEDDSRNPACIADNVGDNVGDVAGMGADLFGSLAESTCAALVIAGASASLPNGLGSTWPNLMYPVTISSSGIITGILTLLLVRIIFKVKTVKDISTSLKAVLFISTILQAVAAAGLTYTFLPPTFALRAFGESDRFKALISVLLGLFSGLAIGFITEYFTSHSYFPVREISRTQTVSAATGIIYGMALGYMSTVVPVLCLAISVCVAHYFCGMYGVALAALGMLSTLTVGLTIDSYGPISDNAGGIVEMAGLGDDVRARTDALDAAGNTTAAIGKGFAIGSAALVSLALFGAFTVRAQIVNVNILDPWTFTGLLFGAMIPYAFSALTMKSVGIAANNMVKECLDQFPKIISGEMEPNYKRCIEISTKASLKEMILPGTLVILSPLLAAGAFGKNCTAGFLAGALVSGIQLAISSSNSGGAWDNAKKYIESGALGPEHSKGSSAHKNAVTGDTVGDPLKDTSGPSLNILVKLSAIVSLVFADYIALHLSNSVGGPWWLTP